jgi:FAD synthase
MLTFKQFLQAQQLNEDKVTALTHQPVDLFIGRFQPFHIGHAQILNGMRNPVVGIVKGAKTSLNKEENPLSFDQQRHLIATVFPSIPVLEFPNGYLPDIINHLKEKHLNVQRVFAGADRIGGYQAQLDRANKKAEQDATLGTFNIEFVETPRITSASHIRDLIRRGDYDQYRRVMPGPLADQLTFDTLQSIMTDYSVEPRTKEPNDNSARL